MARFLMTVWPFAGHIHPNLAVAQALRSIGHEVAFYTGAKAGATVEKEGFACFPLQHVDEALVEHLVLSPEGILSHPRNPLRRKALWRKWTLDTVPAQLADLEPILATWRPDVIVSDPTMWAPFLILNEALSIPVAVFGLTPSCQLPGRDGPILGMSLPRPRNRVDRLKARLLRCAIGLVVADVKREANNLRRSYGLPPLHSSVTAFTGQMPLYLVPGSPEFDYQRDDLPHSVHYVGACLWSKPHNEPPAQWLMSMPRDLPVVYVTEGTIHLQPRILKAAAIGLANLPIRVIMTTGKHRDPQALDLGPRPLASNIRVEQWVPIEDLLPYVDVVVTTGGSNTLQAMLTHGLPGLVVPKDWDHPESGHRLAEAGAGLSIPPEKCSPERLRHAVERLLYDASFGEHARRLGASFTRLGGPRRAAELLVELAAASAPACKAAPTGSLVAREPVSAMRGAAH